MDKLEHKLNSIQNKLGGTKPTPNVFDKLGWHLDYIEELIQSGTKLPYPIEGDEGKVPTVNEDLSFEYKEKADLVGGKVPASQLPSYVDDVLEFSDVDHLPSTGEEGKIYVALDTGFTYRWSGSEYVQIGGQDLSNYVEKTTEINKVYGTSSLGAQYTYSVTDSAVANTIVKRDTTGATKVKGIKVEDKVDFGVKTEGRTNTSYIETDSYDGVTFNVNGVKPLTIYDNGIYVSTSTLPNANGSFDLGKPQNKWKDLYLTGNISDGTNSVTVAHLATNTPAQWYGTQAEYDALGTYDSNTIYNIFEE